VRPGRRPEPGTLGSAIQGWSIRQPPSKWFTWIGPAVEKSPLVPSRMSVKMFPAVPLVKTYPAVHQAFGSLGVPV
jgi:hypothetical protein